MNHKLGIKDISCRKRAFFLGKIGDENSERKMGKCRRQKFNFARGFDKLMISGLKVLGLSENWKSFMT